MSARGTKGVLETLTESFKVCQIDIDLVLMDVNKPRLVPWHEPRKRDIFYVRVTEEVAQVSTCASDGKELWPADTGQKVSENVGV